jgi:hypothetical protein
MGNFHAFYGILRMKLLVYPFCTWGSPRFKASGLVTGYLQH